MVERIGLKGSDEADWKEVQASAYIMAWAMIYESALLFSHTLRYLIPTLSWKQENWEVIWKNELEFQTLAPHQKK